MSAPTINGCLTPGQIADELGCSPKRVEYVLYSRRHLIAPVGRAGIVRLYPIAVLDQVRGILDEMDAHRRTAG